MDATQWHLKRQVSGWLLGFLIFWASAAAAFAGDSIYGTVTAVKSAEVVTLDYGEGQYEVRIIGVEAPKTGPGARRAKQFVSALVLGKKVRIRFDHRAQNGEMVSRLFTAEPNEEIKEVGVEMVRAGLARRQKGYDYKYGELSAAENEAQKNRRGLWATVK